MSIRRITHTIVIGVGPASVPDELVPAAVAETYAGDTVRLVYAVHPTVVTELDWAAVGLDGAGSGAAGAGMFAGMARTLSDKRPGLTVEGLVREGIAASVLAAAAPGWSYCGPGCHRRTPTSSSPRPRRRSSSTNM